MSKPPDEDKVILPDSPEAATWGSVEGWVSRDGYFYGNASGAERLARQNGATHEKCPHCGSIFEARAYCRACRDKRRAEAYAALEEVEWDGAPLADYYGDRYFWDEDALRDYIDDILADNPDFDPSTLQLVLAEPEECPQIDIDDVFDDCLPEDGEVPDAVANAADALNKVIRDNAPYCWRASKKRVKLPKDFIDEVSKDKSES